MFYQIESGICHGRGFAGSDPNGFLAKFYTWVTKTLPNGGPGWFLIDDRTGEADPYIVVCDVAVPVVNSYNAGQNGGAPKFIKIGFKTSEAGYIRIQYLLWWNSTTHVGIPWSGYRMVTGDDIDFAYDFRGGTDCMIVQSRLGTSWSSSIIDEFVGDSNLLETQDKIGTLQSGVLLGSNVVLTLALGEANNFTQDNWYYIYDFSGTNNWVNYVKVTNVNPGANQITVDSIDKNFPSGSVIGSYPHRMYSCGESVPTEVGYNIVATYYVDSKSTIPYSSHKTTPFPTGVIYGLIQFSKETGYLDKMVPNDEGKYAVQRLGIAEAYDNTQQQATTYMNRGYGVTKNMYITWIGTMSPGQDGKTFGGKNYLYFKTENYFMYGGSNNYAILFPDTVEIPGP